MGIFSLTQELAIDLGTANTLIIYNGKVVVDEPSIVALDLFDRVGCICGFYTKRDGVSEEIPSP